ncbi:MAG: hypothetical protein JO263_07470 [Candidatus Eremiobacteraeota bacterium]|nr:hypothetical protein [Candidatus Eremiobacteraeota bacterium]
MRSLIAVGLAVAQVAVTSAPGDRYFGRLKMSALRIRYETMQLKKRYENHDLLPDQTLHLVLLTEDAYAQWAQQYPKDSWLPSTGYALAQLYGELPGAQARDHAVALLTYVKSHFPKTAYATLSRNQLHRGVAVKPYPAWASATPRPQLPATPTLAPTMMPSASPAPTRSPA